jgi:acyl transferase domain-containing protein/acyl carrier protein
MDSESRKQLLKQALQRIEELEAQLGQADQRRYPPIAIIGIGCRFPGRADSPEQYWRNLAAGLDAVTLIPRGRWDVEAFYDPDIGAPGKMYTRHGGFLDNIDRFDPLAFGIAPREAVYMDPQHRLLLEVAWEALEHAGQPVAALSGTATGVFTGITLNDYAQLLQQRGVAGIQAYHLSGNLLNFASGRLSYLLGLHGPAMAVDSACSSSLLAVHLACQSLRTGECKLALAGGVNLILTPNMHITMCKGRLLSPSGRCRTFDESADGMVRSEGCGVVVLKRLDEAFAAGDRVLAIIRGSAANQDGPSGGLTVPNPHAQSQLVHEALTRAGISPHAVRYVEAHGTGTPLGDPIEVRALGKALCEGRPRHAPLLIGSVKTQIGHAESAAGIAGLIKTALALYHGQIPPHLHLRGRNPHIDWDTLAIDIPTDLAAWPDGPRIAGVSAFGASGTNVHVVLEAAPPDGVRHAAPGGGPSADPFLLPLSARSLPALHALGHAYQVRLSQLDDAASLAELAYTAGARRSHHDYRLAVVGSSRSELLEALQRLLHESGSSGDSGGVLFARSQPAPLQVVFVFPGQGSQWLGMGRSLLAEEPSFHAALSACDAAIQNEAGWSLLQMLTADDERGEREQIQFVQPMLFAIEVGLAALWRAWGVEPDAVVGHSMGEIAAAHVAGILPLDQAVRIICRRSRLLQQLSGQGAMALVELNLEQAEQALAGYSPKVSVAVSNGPRSTVLAGDPAALQELLSRLSREGIFCRTVKVDVASHSPQMDPLIEPLLASLGELSPRPAAVRMHSTVTAHPVSGSELSAGYWARNLRQPVRFGQVVEQLLAGGRTAFIEVSPHPILLPAIVERLGEDPGAGIALPSLRRGEAERRALLSSLGALYVHGYAVSFSRLYATPLRVVSLPTYPWQRQSYWLEPGSAAAPSHPLLGAPLSKVGLPQGTCGWQQTLSSHDLPYLTDHRVSAQVALPASAYVELALAAALQQGPGQATCVEQLVFERLCILPPQDPLRIRFFVSEPAAETAHFEISSSGPAKDGGSDWMRCAFGTLRRGESSALRAHETPESIGQRCPRSVAPTEQYQRLRAWDIELLPCFQGVKELLLGVEEVLGRVQLPVELLAQADDYVLHPALLDSCFQVLAALLPAAPAGVTDSFVPVLLERVSVLKRPDPRSELWVHARSLPSRRAEADRITELCGELFLLDEKGDVLVEAHGLQLRQVAVQRLHHAGVDRVAVDDLLYHLFWQRKERMAAVSPAAGAFVLFVDGKQADGQDSTGAALAALLAARGHRCVQVVLGDAYARLTPDFYTLDLLAPETFSTLLADAFPDAPPQAAIHLWSLSATPAEATSLRSLQEDQRRGTLSALYLAQALLHAGWRQPPRLWLVTRGAHDLEPEPGAAKGVEPAQAPLWGFGRTLALEHPELRTTLVDLDPCEGAWPSEPESLLSELLSAEVSGEYDDQLALRRGGRHVARLVRGATVAPRIGAPLRENATYLITGGLGGLGLSVAKWMVEAGARQLVLLGRHASSAAAEQAVAPLREAGASVLLSAVDVADPVALAAVLRDLEGSLPPLRGIVHAAGVLADRTVLELSWDRLLTAMAPKVFGAWNLHALTLSTPLDFFVLYSGAAALLGSPGQGNYAAANAFLDALALYRRQLGLPAISITWGPFSEVGLAAAQRNRGERLSHRGLSSLTPAQGIEALARLITAAPAQVAVLELDVRKWLESYPSAARSALWTELLRAGESSLLTPVLSSGKPPLRQQIAEAPPTFARGLLENHLTELLGRVLHLPAAQLDPEATFGSLGMDSLMSLEIRNRLEASLGLTLSATLLYTYPNLRRLADYLLTLHRKEVAGEAPPAPAQPDGTAAFEPIAIIGMACRFPGGADSPETLWNLLQAGIDAVTTIPPERAPLFHGGGGELSAERFGAFLSNVDCFDPQFFAISPREAERLDPQQRMLLEVAWEALERAGLADDQLQGSRTGVFIGMSNTDYALLSAGADPEAQDVYDMTGNGHCFPPGRLSYFLGLTGPSLTVDTACSSSLVAVHLACQSLRRGESTMALAGGVNLILSSTLTGLLAKASALSPDGRCKAFDAQANGFVRGEGCAVVVLKRVSDALRDGDKVLALIRGSAVNQDGRSTGLTAPNVLSQQALLQQALADARLEAAQVGYVETHGTGTSLGDPIEFEALKAVLGGRLTDAGEDTVPCVLGAVKTNLGHLEAAAGVAGLMKAVLCLRHQSIPRNLHWQTLNPLISLSDTRFVIPMEPVAWPAGDRPRFAGVSSFGLSGTNAHVILAEPPPAPAPVLETAAPGYLLPLSAKSPQALAALARAVAAELAADPSASLHDVAYTASVRRSHHACRLALFAQSRQELTEGLVAYANGGAVAELVSGKVQSSGASRLVFVFPGQGSQWLGMGRQLLQMPQASAFGAMIETCEPLIRQAAGFSITAQLFAAEQESRLAEIAVLQPLLFALQVALAAQWRAFGAEPDVVIGHSMGEVAAAQVAGALQLFDAVRIICTRSRLLQRLSGQGAMALVELPLAEAETAIAGREALLSIAASNGPRSTVLAGQAQALDAVLRDLSARGIFCRRVKVDVASHSPQMDALAEDLRAELAGVGGQPPAVRMISTVSGEAISGTELGPEYWVKNLRQPVRFFSVVQDLVQQGYRLFVELGPHPILLPAIQETLSESTTAGTAVGTLRRDTDELRSLCEGLGALYAAGYAVKWQRLYPRGGNVVALPTYPFTRGRFWIEDPASPRAPRRSDRQRTQATSEHPLLGATLPVAVPGLQLWEQTIRTDAPAYLAEHRLQGTAVFPAAGYVEAALAAGISAQGPLLPGAGLCLEDLSFVQLLALPPQGQRSLQVALAADRAGHSVLTIASRAEGELDWQPHVRGKLRPGPAATEPSAEPLERVLERLRDGAQPVDYPATDSQRGVFYGPAFRGLCQLWLGSAEALGRVELPESLAEQAGAYQVHPALLDACLQVTIRLLAQPDAGGKSGDRVHVPVAIERLIFSRRPDRSVWVRAQRRPAGSLRDSDGEQVFDLQILDDPGSPLLALSGLHVRLLDADPRSTAAWSSRFADCGYRVVLRQSELPPPPSRLPVGLPGGKTLPWLLFADQGGTLDALSGLLRERGETCVFVTAGAGFRRLSPERYEIDLSHAPDYHALLREVCAASGACRGVIHAFSLDAAPPTAATTETVVADLRRGSISTTLLVQAMVRQGFRELPRLWLITRGAQAAPLDREIAFSQAPLWGLFRALSLEHPELACRCIDLDAAAASDDAPRLLEELTASDGEDQVLWRKQGRYVLRLTAGALQRPDASALRLAPAAGRAFRLEIHKPGTLGELGLYEAERRQPGPDEVELAVEAAGLNFLDVLLGLGILPDDSPAGDNEGPRLGGECVGRIIAVGSAVTDLRIGEQVLALGPRAFGSFLTTRRVLVAPVPRGLSAEQAATIPIAFLTAAYALSRVGRVRRGERVLIHAGAGGVGGAAIQWAQRIGAEIFATAGSEEKRALLRSLGVAHVMDSRSPRFADELLRVTAGEGVDLVLNSLSGEFIAAGLSVLRDHGRFIEIGKRDFYENRPLGLRPFLRSLTFSLVDLRAVIEGRPAEIQSLLAELLPLFESGALSPLPSQSFAIDQAEAAFNQMAQAKHCGKLVLTLPDAAAADKMPIRAKASRKVPSIRAAATYLVSGGCGGLGIEVARFLVSQGARHLALLGRRAPSIAAQQAIDEMIAGGAQVMVLRADLSSRDATAAALATLAEQLPPLAGIVHAATILEDHVIAELLPEHFLGVAGGKVLGAFHLHALTLDRPLDFFVLYSSMAAVLGSPGQGNYCAANAFVDALAHHRRALGLPAMSIRWGPFSDVGLAAAKDTAPRRLSDRGFDSLSPTEGSAALALLLAEPQVELGVARFDIRHWAEFYPHTAYMPFFAELFAEAERRQKSAWAGTLAEAPARQMLLAAPPGERRRRLENHLCEQLARVLRLAAERIDRGASFTSLGMDSLTSLELRNRLETSLGLRLTATLLFTYPTPKALAENLLMALALALPRPPAPPAGLGESDAEPSSRLEELTEKEVAAAIDAEIAGLEQLS